MFVLVKMNNAFLFIGFATLWFLDLRLINGHTDAHVHVHETQNWILRSAERCNTSCGESIYDTRIINGKTVKTSEFPWMAAIFNDDQFICGGTLINDLYVLTAAHCILGKNFVKNVKILLGTNNIHNLNSESDQIHRVEEVVKHNFTWVSYQYDLALLKLSSKIRKFSHNINPIMLPLYRREQYIQREGIVSGWGLNNLETKKESEILKSATLPIISNDECRNLYASTNDIYDSQICTRYPHNGIPQDACQGDSGGPLMHVKDSNYYEIIGIISWGRGCADHKYPGVYTRVTSYLEWIYRNTLDACRCYPA